MITEPSVEKLNDKADSPYTLVILAAKRARHINLTEEELLDEYKGDKKNRTDSSK